MERPRAGTQFTSFTGTKVQILTQLLGQKWSDLEQYASCAHHLTGTQFTGFTGTKVQILTLLEEVPVADARGRQLHRYTCFTSTKKYLLY
jgi:hypothetical protein